MICLRRKIVFVHLRRTAGNSIEIALGGIRLFDAEGRETMHWDNRLHRGRSRFKLDLRGHAIHATAEEIRRRHRRDFDACFRFAVVRNPWEQMASLYGRLVPEDAAFTGFPRWLGRFRLQAGTVPAASLFARDGRCLVDFVCRYERLQDDFDTACDRAGLPRQRLPETNRSCRIDLAAVYDDDRINVVRRIFRDDIDRLGYDFEERATRTDPGSVAAVDHGTLSSTGVNPVAVAPIAFTARTPTL